MDRAKVGKYGKYKPFIILSILMQAIGAGCLFFIPSNGSKVLTCAWVIIFYLIYDMGASFYAPNLIYRSLTLDSNQRGKLMIAPRLTGMMMGMFTAALIAIVNGVNASMNNMHTAFGVTVLTLLVITSAISLLGISLVKEALPIFEKFSANAYGGMPVQVGMCWGRNTKFIGMTDEQVSGILAELNKQD